MSFLAITITVWILSFISTICIDKFGYKDDVTLGKFLIYILSGPFGLFFMICAWLDDKPEMFQWIEEQLNKKLF